MMRRSPLFRLALLSLPLLAAAARARAADTDCSKNESGLGKADWVYPMPKIDQLPPAARVAQDGAFVILDELTFAGSDTVYTLIVQVGTRAAIDRFQSVGVDTGFSEFAEIKARVMAPGGTVQEMTDADITCKVTSFAMAGFNIGKAAAPKHYVVNIRGLVPGAVLQYQITRRQHLDKGYVSTWQDKPDDDGDERGELQDRDRDGDAARKRTEQRYVASWRDWFSTLVSFRQGSQQKLTNTLYENLLDDAFRYQAANVQVSYLIPRGMKFEYKVLNDNGRVNVREIPRPRADLDKIIQFTYSRGALPKEPFEPYLLLQDPELVTWVRSTEKNNITPYKISPADWGEMVTQDLADPLAMMTVRGGVDAFKDLAQNAAPGSRGWVDALNRHLRDRVASATGSELRTAFGYRPPSFVIKEGRIGTFLEKSLALIATLRQAGVPAALVLARTRGLPPINRGYPISDWFGHYLVAVDYAQGRVFYDPSALVPSGEIRESLQGGEGLLVKDRKTWEWITLPVSAPEANGARTEYRIETIEGDAVSGVLTTTWRGADAAAIRFALREADPGEEQRVMTGLAEEMGFPGVRCESPRVENLRDPDQPLTLHGRFAFTAAVTTLGARRKLRWLPGHPGPKLEQFAADHRSRPLDFAVPARYETVVLLPAALSAGTELPASVDLGANGLSYSLAGRAVPEGLELKRTLTVTGVIPAANYPEVRKFFSEVDRSDQSQLPLGAAGAK